MVFYQKRPFTRALERQFQSRLLERSKKNFRLTAEGEVLYDYSKKILQSYDEIHNRLQEIKGVISGKTHIATVYSIGLYDLQPYVQRFLKDCPSVNVNVEYRRSNEVYEDILGNVADLGLVISGHDSLSFEMHFLAGYFSNHPE